MRTMSTALAAHLQQTSTTTARLLKIKLKSGIVYGICTLDRAISYNDGSGDGLIRYVATSGFDPSTFSADSGYSVNNAEAMALISEEIDCITEEMVNAGALEDAQWVCYLVNFMDLSMGHLTLDAGDLGEVTTSHGLLWVPELLSYVTRLKQPIGMVDSTTCRAIFGSPSDSQTGCGVDVTPLWETGTVQSVGAESNRVFIGDNVTISGNPIPYPGRVQFLTGANAGRELSTEQIDNTTVYLSDTTPYPIEAGDTYRIRPDCLKRYTQDCIGVWNNGVNFKGEPHIPVGDAQAVQVPNARRPRSVWGSLEGYTPP